jgi:hypothetical protein
MPARFFDEGRGRMKKNQERNKEQNKKLRRLTLSRETIQVLDDPALLLAVQGGFEIRSTSHESFPSGCC